MSDADPAVLSRDDLASPWRRLGATLVDACIVGLPYGVVVGVWLAANDKPFEPRDDLRGSGS